VKASGILSEIAGGLRKQSLIRKGRHETGDDRTKGRMPQWKVRTMLTFVCAPKGVAGSGRILERLSGDPYGWLAKT